MESMTLLAPETRSMSVLILKSAPLPIPVLLIHTQSGPRELVFLSSRLLLFSQPLTALISLMREALLQPPTLNSVFHRMTGTLMLGKMLLFKTLRPQNLLN